MSCHFKQFVRTINNEPATALIAIGIMPRAAARIVAAIIAIARGACFVEITAGMPDRIIFSALMLLMAILTNIVSNNAAAVIGTPIAISIANQLGLPPEAFVLAVLFGANMSYATPMAYQTNLLVMNAGGYTFTDFVKAGVPLTIIIWLAFSFIVPIMYNF